MLPSSLEYLLLVVIYGLLVYALLQRQIHVALIRKEFWISALLFCSLWTILEYYALANNWWMFNRHKICNIVMLGIPIEEYVVFVLMHLSMVALLESFRNELD
jgi:lycopene cyclase domain-containing protein